MNPDASVEKFYDELFKLNPELTCKRQTEPRDLRQFTSISIDGFVYTGLMYTADIDSGNAELKCQPYTYKVMFAAGLNESGLPVAPFDQTGYADYSKCKFFDQFFVRSPNDIRIIECKSSTLCEKLGEAGEWCNECYAKLNRADNLVRIMHNKLNFADIPKETIFHIERRYDERILRNRMDLLEKNKNKIFQYQKLIADFPKRIQQLIEQEFDRYRDNENELKNLLANYGSTDMIGKEKSLIQDAIDKFKAEQGEEERRQLHTQYKNEYADLKKKMAELKSNIEATADKPA